MIAGKIDRYLLKSSLGLFGGLAGLALAILLLERLVRIAEIVSGSGDNSLAAARMIANLVPHYLELALPAALLICIIVAVDRLSRSGEIVALMNAGISLVGILRPFLVMGAVLGLVSLYVTGFLQPQTRYDYRQTVHELRQQSVVTAFQEAKFVQIGDRVIWTEYRDGSGRRLGQTFILETVADGSRRFLSSAAGELSRSEDGDWRIALINGVGGTLPVNLEEERIDAISFDQVVWPLRSGSHVFRMRGADERELTLVELWELQAGRLESEIPRHVAAAAFHDRVSRAALLPVLPLIGVVLGMNLKRRPRGGGVAIGILVLLFFQKMLEYAQIAAERGAVPPWLGAWLIVGVGTAVACFLFWRVGQANLSPLFGRRPLHWPPWLRPLRGRQADAALPDTGDGGQSRR